MWGVKQANSIMVKSRGKFSFFFESNLDSNTHHSLYNHIKLMGQDLFPTFRPKGQIERKKDQKKNSSQESGIAKTREGRK